MWIAAIVMCAELNRESKCIAGVMKDRWKTEAICKQKVLAEARETQAQVETNSVEITLIEMQCYHVLEGPDA
jgi:hypothetical protein